MDFHSSTLFFFIDLAASIIPSATPLELIFMIVSYSSMLKVSRVGILFNGNMGPEIPALLKRTSNGPSLLSIWAMADCQSACFVASNGIQMAAFYDRKA